MIQAADIAAAERTLGVIYGGPLDRQLSRMQVDREAFDNFIAEKREMIKRRYGDAWGEMDPRLEPAINTLLVHFFLVGLICGHNEMRSR